MPVYRSIEEDTVHVLRLKNLILLLTNGGLDPTALSERLQASPPTLVSRAISELIQEGKLELSNSSGG